MVGMTELPYNGTAGYVAGSRTSTERAQREALDGTATRRQQDVLDLLDCHPAGLTWNEAGAMLGLHHGQISGCLSVLHKAGKVVQLVKPRGRCSPYLALRYVQLYSPADVRFSPLATSAGRRLKLLEAVAEAAQQHLTDNDLWSQRALEDALQALRQHHAT